MASRLAACEPCRKAKLACDHSQPVCKRCRSNNRPGICIYRTAPFKRRKTDGVAPVDHSSHSLHNIGSPQATHPASSPSAPNFNHYPNPGYVGPSSHVAIFSHITPTGDQSFGTGLTVEATLSAAPRTQPDDDFLIQRGADALKQLFNIFPLQSMKGLVNQWRVKGRNLSVSGAIIDHCIDTIDLPSSISTNENWHLLYAKHLLTNSTQSLKFSQTSTFSDFCAQILEENIRWETLGMFVSAVTRATMDITFFPPLYSNEETKHTLRRLCTRVGDYALEISLSLDCLNDLQLLLQYENFVVHSHVDGDQSYYSWRKLGDVISSIYALGYHENLDEKPEAPPFLTELRKAVFARTYSGDKNIAIFVGRPPRMSRQFCHFQIPSCPTSSDIWLLSSTKTNDGTNDIRHWSHDAKASFVAETRWSALCASLKEDILNLRRDKPSNTNTFHRKVAEIESKAEKQFALLPQHFQLQGSLKECTPDPFERDFVGAIRLNHLHVLFTLHLLLLNTPTEPDPAIVEVAEEMLSITVDMILLRDQLTHSGTSLVWKVACYGLPAAGILLLAILNQRYSPTTSRMAHPRALQHLTILAAELQAGSIIRPREANYELMSKATQTIQSFLDSVTTEAIQSASVLAPRNLMNNNWPGFSYQHSLDFEIGFWQSLADHPFLNFHPGLMAPE